MLRAVGLVATDEVRCYGVRAGHEGCLSFLSFAEEVGMHADAVKGNDAYFCVFLVNQKPVGIDVALPIAFVVTSEEVIVKVGWQGFAVLKHPNDSVQVA